MAHADASSHDSTVKTQHDTSQALLEQYADKGEAHSYDAAAVIIAFAVLVSQSDLHALRNVLREIRTTEGGLLVSDAQLDTEHVLPMATFALSHMLRLHDDVMSKYKEATELLEARSRELNALKSAIGIALTGAK